MAALTQSAILVLSGGAFVLLQSKRATTRRLACVLGIVAQAFWLHATWSASQWGMFGLALLYGVVYLRELVALHHKRNANPEPPMSYWEYRAKLPK